MIADVLLGAGLGWLLVSLWAWRKVARSPMSRKFSPPSKTSKVKK